MKTLASLPISFATSRSWSPFRETSASFAPAPASARAIAFPSPLLAPVIRATLPLSFFSVIHVTFDSDSMGRVDDPVGDRLWAVDIRKGQPAALARCLNREIADAAHPLRHRLPHSHVLDFRELNRARGLREHPRLVTEL